MTPTPHPDQVNLVLFHNDLDGFAAAWAAWRRLGGKAQYLAVQYGWELPKDLEGKHIAVVDFSYHPDDMEQLMRQAASLIVLDHHKTVQTNFPEGHPNIVLDLNHSGAVLSWKWFHPDVEIPPALLLVQDYDLWQWKLEQTRAFQYGVQDIPWKPYHLSKFDLAITTGMKQTLRKGKVLCDYVDSQIQRGIKQAALVSVHPLGIQAWMFNGHVPWYSELGTALVNQKDSEVVVALIWTYLAREKAYLCSLRSREGSLNVGEMAHSLGGGGHPHAGGFMWRGTLEELFSVVDVETSTTSPGTSQT